MRTLTGVVACTLLLGTATLQAQQDLIGKYEANFYIISTVEGGGIPIPQSAVLELTGVDNGKLSGKLSLARYGCRGTYSVQGTVQSGKLDMQTGTGPIRGCGQFPLVLNAQGGKLVGTMGNMSINVEFVRK